MRFVQPNRSARVVYAEIIEAEDGTPYEFVLSPFPEVQGARRPMARFDTQEELEAAAAVKGCEVQWLAK